MQAGAVQAIAGRAMTMPHERTRALLWAGGFLIELARDENLPTTVRQRGVAIARHFPTIEDVSHVAVFRHPDSAWGLRCQTKRLGGLKVAHWACPGIHPIGVARSAADTRALNTATETAQHVTLAGKPHENSSVRPWLICGHSWSSTCLRQPVNRQFS